MQQEQPAQATAVVRTPTTRAQLDALIAARSELRSQLQAVNIQRIQLTGQAAQSAPDARPEIQSRINALSARAGNLEGRVLRADEAIAEALERGVAEPGTFVTVQTPPPPPAPGARFGRQDIDAIIAPVVLGEALAFVLLGIVFYRWVWKRAQRAVAPRVESSTRLDALQQAVDVIALEVERISEGQRYVTRVLNEKLAIGAGEAQPVGAPRKAAEPARKPGHAG